MFETGLARMCHRNKNKNSRQIYKWSLLFFQVQVDPPHPRIGFDKWIEKDQWYRGGKCLGVFRLHCNRN